MGIIVMLLNVIAATIARGSFQEGLTMFLGYGIFAYLVPLAVAVQMALFAYHRNMAAISHRLERVSISGSAISSMTMVACCICCAYQVSGMLPAIGFLLSASSLLTRYGDAIITVGLAINAIGSILLLRAILRHKKERAGPIVYTV